MDSEVFIEHKCSKVTRVNDWAFYCHDCSQQEFSVICVDCFDKNRHFGHYFETVVCEAGVRCDCGNDLVLKSDGFCAKHSQQLSKNFDRARNRSLKSSSGSSVKSRKQSEYVPHRRESEGFFDGILHLFSSKPLELPEFYDLAKVSKYSLDGILIAKYFDRSRAHYLENELKLKRIYEINKLSNKYPNKEFLDKKRMLLWYSIDNSKGSDGLSKVLHNGISYENGKMGRALYFRDRIKRFIKFSDHHFGILLLCEVAVGNMYKVFTNKKYYREAPFGYDSLKCVGNFTPDPSKYKTIGNGIVVPIGKTVANNDTIENTTDFDINQFIVFDKTQVIVRYLVQYHEHHK